jgi:glycosyltransferase involved in cell wall biosynthesis
MKVLHVVAGNLTGGAARGAYWLHLGLLEEGVQSHVLISGRKHSDDRRVSTIRKGWLSGAFIEVRARLDKVLTVIYFKREKLIFSSGFFGIDITKRPEYKLADIIHFHWINSGFINFKHLNKIKKPLVWTLRDMWPMTGGCHLAEAIGCDKYKTGCGRCEQLNSRFENDLSRYIVLRKRKSLPIKTKIVAISPWLEKCAKDSYMFRDFDVRCIDNNINTNIFYPEDIKSSRELLGIKTRKKIILVGASSIRQFYKGFSKFLESLSYLSNTEIFLVFFGEVDDEQCNSLGFDYLNLGLVKDDGLLRKAYSAADVFVAPSIMDSFGKTIAEAMACATPVVCFDATGPQSIVIHLENGYKAEPFSPESLADGVKWVLSYPDYQKLSEKALHNAVSRFDSSVVAKEYIDLYEELLT